MANQKLQIDILANDRSKQTFDRLQGSLSKARAAVFNLKNAFIGLGTGLVLRSIVNVGVQVENLGVQLKALFGSAREGQKALDIVTRFAATTPFELENIQQGITALATVRKQAERAGVSFEELLRITGNTATVLGGDFALAALQIQRSFSAGIASAELFRERGVTAMAGFSQGVRTSVEDSIRGLKRAFGTGGEFGNLIEELSKTLSGTISNLKDTLFRFQIAITRGFFFELKEQLGDLKQFTEDNAQALETLGVQIGEKLADAIVKLSNGIKTLVENFRDLQSIIGLLTIAFGGLFGKIAGVGLIVDDINRRIKKLTGDTEISFQRIREIGHDLSIPIENLNKELEYTAQIIHDFEHELSVKVPNATEKAMQKFRELNQGAIQKLEDKMNNIEMIMAEGLAKGIKTMSDQLAQAFVFGKKLSDTFRSMAQNFLAKILSTLIEVVARKYVELAIEKMITNEKKKQAALSAVSGSGGLFSSIGGILGRDKGGSVQKGKPYIVGERGAELFIPNQSGQITQAARGTSGGQTTVNFNINTLDASGFDDLLIRNRGTITQIINNAVNERGNRNLI
jgi:uncharacterized coiled-coil protein SlyX